MNRALEEQRHCGIVLVPPEGFSDHVARELLRLSVEEFAVLQGELVFGEWTLMDGKQRIMLPGMCKLACLSGNPLRFEAREGRGQKEEGRSEEGRNAQRSRILEWEMENGK